MPVCKIFSVLFNIDETLIFQNLSHEFFEIVLVIICVKVESWSYMLKEIFKLYLIHIFIIFHPERKIRFCKHKVLELEKDQGISVVPLIN